MYTCISLKISRTIVTEMLLYYVLHQESILFGLIFRTIISRYPHYLGKSPCSTPSKSKCFGFGIFYIIFGVWVHPCIKYM